MLYIDKVDSLQTEPIHIRAENLDIFSCYKIRLELHHETGSHASFGVFYSDGFGVIDLKREAPIRGTYHGIDEMGLFASLTPTETFQHGSMVKCTQGEPWYYTLKLFSPTDSLLDTLHLKKHWKHPKVSRIEIPELHGVLYKPPGPGPFPCVLDIIGANGGIPLERPASMLASHGFMTLTFFYYSTKNADNLSDKVVDVDVESFRRPIEFLKSHPNGNGKLGLIGMSFGGLIANYLACKFSGISAVISMNFTMAFDEEMTIRENGKRIATCGSPDGSLIIKKNGVLDIAKKYLSFYDELEKKHKMPWEKVEKLRYSGWLEGLMIGSWTR